MTVPREATIEIAATADGAVLVRLLHTSAPSEGMHDYIQLAVDPLQLPPLTDAASVAQHGRELLKALQTHDAISSELQQIFRIPSPDTTSLEFAMSGTAGPDMRWEVICAEPPPDYLALTGRCSLKRIVPSKGPSHPGVRLFSGPVRLAAYLSPAGVPSKPEFDGLVAAVRGAHDKGLKVDAIVYLGEQDLLTEALQDAAAGKLPGITPRPIPSNAIDMEKSLIRDQAQIVHFFCHGDIQANVHLLEMASINDNDLAEEKGSITLSLERLRYALTATGAVWMTVLNSCSGARSVRKLQSMAATLASTASPTAIGMAEPIPDEQANLFAGRFYMRALDAIFSAIHELPPGQPVSIDFGFAVAHARMTMRDAAIAAAAAGGPDCFGNWCLPILYQREGGLKVARVADVDIGNRINEVAHALQALPLGTPTALRDEFLALLDSVPAALRPDRFGTLP